ncbi:unnamed protein product [Pleuronectes platessa]|uniref:Uncharacterized protein n=1 Tax=Pleuronectes platessa TaxID=8262 RepID=A0A9N7U2S0_PLEPL|nr:unnamed protein product [Pleuronectes platessa]
MTGGGLVAETWTMGREGLWFVSGSTPRRDNKRRTWIDLSKNPRVSLPCLVPLSKAPYSPNICSPSAYSTPVPRLRPPLTRSETQDLSSSIAPGAPPSAPPSPCYLAPAAALKAWEASLMGLARQGWPHGSHSPV